MAEAVNLAMHGDGPHDPADSTADAPAPGTTSAIDQTTAETKLPAEQNDSGLASTTETSDSATPGAEAVPAAAEDAIDDGPSDPTDSAVHVPAPKMTTVIDETTAEAKLFAEQSDSGLASSAQAAEKSVLGAEAVLATAEDVIGDGPSDPADSAVNVPAPKATSIDETTAEVKVSAEKSNSGLASTAETAENAAPGAETVPAAAEAGGIEADVDMVDGDKPLALSPAPVVSGALQEDAELKPSDDGSGDKQTTTMLIAAAIQDGDDHVKDVASSTTTATASVHNLEPRETNATAPSLPQAEVAEEEAKAPGSKDISTLHESGVANGAPALAIDSAGTGNNKRKAAEDPVSLNNDSAKKVKMDAPEADTTANGTPARRKPGRPKKNKDAAAVPPSRENSGRALRKTRSQGPVDA